MNEILSMIKKFEKKSETKKCPAIPVISPLDFFVEKKAVQIVAFLIAAVA